MTLNETELVRLVREAFPDVQAVYLFGSFAGDEPWPDSDVDIALLLPPEQAKRVGNLYMTDLRWHLQDVLRREVDVINLRQVSTVFQKEIVTGGRRLDCRDEYAADEFEMLVLSFYQKLNEERRGILDAFWKTGRAYPV